MTQILMINTYVKSDEYHQIKLCLFFSFASLSKTLWLSGQEFLFLKHSSETILGQFSPN